MNRNCEKQGQIERLKTKIVQTTTATNMTTSDMTIHESTPITDREIIN